MTISALYTDPRGPYASMAGVEPWGLPDRDATKYAGPWPVVAHPPCGPWGRYAHKCHQRADLAPLAVAQVRRWGGAPEHPATSRLWAHCGLPRVDELPGSDPGFSLYVEQWWWGHAAIKPTLLYIVGLRGPLPPIPVPTGPRPDGSRHGSRLEKLAKSKRHLTPPPFARWLVTLASRCVPADPMTRQAPPE